MDMVGFDGEVRGKREGARKRWKELKGKVMI